MKLLLALATGASAVKIQIFRDNACTNPSTSTIQNPATQSSINLFAGVCTPASFIFPLLTGSVTNFMESSIGLDVCSPTFVRLGIFSSANRAGGDDSNANDLTWTDPDACALPRLTTVSLVPGVCTQVQFVVPGNAARAYRALLTEYWLLPAGDAPQCTAPVPQLVFRTLHPNNAGTVPPACGVPRPTTNWLLGTYFNDLPLFSGPWAPASAGSSAQYGFCNLNTSTFANGGLAGARPWENQISLGVSARNAADPTLYTIEVFNNVPISTGTGSVATFAGCATARQANADATPTSPHYIGSFTIRASANPSVDECTDNPGPAPVTVIADNAWSTRVRAQGFDFYQLSGRLFSARTFATSAVAPPEGPGRSQAQVTEVSAVANTGIILGSVGVGVAALALGALAYVYRQLAAERATARADRGTAAWGEVAKGAAGGPALNPLAINGGAVPV